MRFVAVLETLLRRSSSSGSSKINTSYAVLRRCCSSSYSFTTESMWYPGINRYIDPSNPIASSLHTQILTKLHKNTNNSVGYVLLCNTDSRFRSVKPAEPNQLDLVQSLIEDGELDAAVDITRRVFSKTTPVSEICDLVLEAMYDAGRYEDVQRLFEFFYLQKNMLTSSNISHWTPSSRSYCILIKTHFATGHPEWAVEIFEVANMDCPDLSNTIYMNLITKGLVSAGRLSQAVTMTALHVDLPVPACVYNNLIYGFLEVDDIDAADKYFHNLCADQRGFSPSEDAIVFATYMEYYFKLNMEESALEFYQRFLNHQNKMSTAASTAACNQVLQVLVKYGKSVEANTLFDNMLNARISLDITTSFGFGVNSETYNIMVNESFRSGNVLEALSLFNTRKGSDKTSPEIFIMDSLGYNNIIAKLCDIGMLEEAEKLFQEAVYYKPVKRECPHVHAFRTRRVPIYYEVDSPPRMANVTTFKIIFNAYFKEESIDKVLKWFKFLLFETSLKPSYVLVNSVLSRLITRGRIEDAVEILGKMPLRDTEPFPTSYELVLTELCKGGNLDCVLYLVGLMVRYKVGITPKLYSILCEPFRKNDFMDLMVRLLKRPVEASYADLQK